MIRRKRTIILTLLIVVVILSIVWIICAANTYTYTHEELKTFMEKDEYTDVENILAMFGTSVTTNVRLKQFYKFTCGETTRQQVIKAIGQPHCTGDALLSYPDRPDDIYLTTDKQMIYMYYDNDDVLAWMYRKSMETGVIIDDFE